MEKNLGVKAVVLSTLFTIFACSICAGGNVSHHAKTAELKVKSVKINGYVGKEIHNVGTALVVRTLRRYSCPCCGIACSRPSHLTARSQECQDCKMWTVPWHGKFFRARTGHETVQHQRRQTLSGFRDGHCLSVGKSGWPETGEPLRCACGSALSAS